MRDVEFFYLDPWKFLLSPPLQCYCWIYLVFLSSTFLPSLLLSLSYISLWGMQFVMLSSLEFVPAINFGPELLENLCIFCGLFNYTLKTLFLYFLDGSWKGVLGLWFLCSFTVNLSNCKTSSQRHDLTWMMSGSQNNIGHGTHKFG